MAIKRELADKIEKLNGIDGLSIRKIADKLGINREFVRRFLSGSIEVEESDTKLTQNVTRPHADMR